MVSQGKRKYICNLGAKYIPPGVVIDPTFNRKYRKWSRRTENDQRDHLFTTNRTCPYGLCLFTVRPSLCTTTTLLDVSMTIIWSMFRWVWPLETLPKQGLNPYSLLLVPWHRPPKNFCQDSPKQHTMPRCNGLFSVRRVYREFLFRNTQTTSITWTAVITV